MTVLTIRSSTRYAVRQAALITCPNGVRTKGLLIELSQQGGRISGLGSTNFTNGDIVFLEMDDRVLPSVVRWTNPGLIGVRFEKALYSAELTALLIDGTSGLSLPMPDARTVKVQSNISIPTRLA